MKYAIAISMMLFANYAEAGLIRRCRCQDMPAINENTLSITIAKREGGKKQVDIAQIKEIQKIMLEELGKYKDGQVLRLINKHR